jgi:Protein of unknown function (DUF2505)
MSCPIRYQSRYAVPAEQLYATLVDREFLQAKLDSIGGTNAALLDLASDADSAKYTLRQCVNREYLPGPVQKILRGDLIIERTETWRLAAPGRYEGTVTARMKDAPGSIGGGLKVIGIGTETAASSEFGIEAAAKVDVPLIGGKIESAIAEQVVKLMDREARFTQQWLAR